MVSSSQRTVRPVLVVVALIRSMPEALHLAVRATRYGCTDDETSQWSSKAFQLLRRRYPKSEWAAKTKYHY